MSDDIKIQVVAFPGTPYRRLKDELAKWKESGMPDGSELRFVQSRNDYYAEVGEREIHEIETNIQDGYVHIAVLPTRNFAAFGHLLMDCRVISLNGIRSEFKALTVEDVRSAVLGALEYEKRWCRVVRPDDWHHPLCLPRPTFEAKADIGDYWKECDCYRDTRKIGVAHDLLQRIVARHRHSAHGEGTYWIDADSRRYRVDRSRHGLTPAERAGKKLFRFAWEVPTGLHFDVTHQEVGRSITLKDAGSISRGCIRANVNPWGHVVIKA